MDTKKILLGGIIIMYFVVFQKKTTNEKSNLENKTLKSNPVSNRKPIPNSNPAVQLPQQPVIRLAAPAQPLRSSSSSAMSVTAVKPTNPPDELVNPKCEQIIPEYGDYAATPKVLTGNSAKVFSLTFPRYLMPDIELKDIQSAFVNGIYHPKEIIKILGLADIFEGTIYVDDEIKFQVTWNLQISANQNPVQGIFSLQMNGTETSCTPLTFSPRESRRSYPYFRNSPRFLHR